VREDYQRRRPAWETFRTTTPAPRLSMGERDRGVSERSTRVLVARLGNVDPILRNACSGHKPKKPWRGVKEQYSTGCDALPFVLRCSTSIATAYPYADLVTECARLARARSTNARHRHIAEIVTSIAREYAQGEPGDL